MYKGRNKIMRKNLALILSAALMISMMSNAVIPALASEGSADNPYKLILTEEPKPSSGSRKAAGEAAAAAAAEQAAQTEGSDTAATTATLIREPAAEMPARRPRRLQNLRRTRRTMFPSPAQTRSIR